MIKQKMGLIVSTRSFFPSHLVKTAKDAAIEKLKDLGLACVTVDKETEYGAIRTFGEAKICAELFRKHADEIGGIIVILPNFGDELGVVEAISMAGLNVPVLVQACNDELNKLDMGNRRDAFCGKISVCNNLYQRGIRFTNTSLHTCDIGSQAFEDDIRRFAGVCRVVNGLRGARIAMLGARPLAFNTVRYSEKILQKHGISVQTVDLSEIISSAMKNADQSRIDEKIQEIKHYGNIPSYVDEATIIRQAKLCLVIEDFVENLACDASAVQCWDSLENNYGCAACLSMSMMGDKGKPSACESDVTGALSMLTAQLAANSAPALMDWNNNIDEEENSCVALHCSNFPKRFFNTEIEIEYLDVLGSTLGKERCFGACKGQVAPGEMTFLRLTTDDARGTMKMYVGEGEFKKEKIPTKGGVANCYVKNLQEMLHYICKNGFEHHVCFVRGYVADIIEEACANYLGIDVYKHN